MGSGLQMSLMLGSDKAQAIFSGLQLSLVVPSDPCWSPVVPSSLQQFLMVPSGLQ